ncbi:OsmC family protein [Allosphingosinicella humi]
MAERRIIVARAKGGIAAVRDWPLVRAAVDLTFTRGDDDSRIDRVITLEDDLTPEQEARLADVAERTPVTLTLKSGVEIRTDLRRTPATV